MSRGTGVGPSRRLRVGHAMRDQLAAMIDRDVKDPRVSAAGLVSVNHVELNRDRTVARVYVSFVTTDSAQIKIAMAGLQAAAGFLRGPMGRRMKLARTPEFRFVHDTSPEFQARLSALVAPPEVTAPDAYESVDASVVPSELTAEDSWEGSPGLTSENDSELTSEDSSEGSPELTSEDEES